MKRIILGLSMLLMLAQNGFAKTVFEKYGLEIGNGKTVWLRADWDGSCYTLDMGGDRYGSATNCNREVNNYWSVSGCGSSQSSINGGVTEVANKMLELCQR